MRYVWILLVAVVGTPQAWAEDLNDDGCEDAQYADNGACISDSASLDATVTTAAGTFVGAEASIGPFVALDDVRISPRATLDGWLAHTTQPLPVGLGTIVGRNAVLGVDHILGPDTTISRAVTAGARLTTSTGATVGYAADLGTDVTIDANGTVGSLVTLGDFTRVGPAAVIARGTTVASAATLSQASTIFGVVGPHVSIGSGVMVEGTARVRKQATLLPGARVLDGARVGRGATVEAGAAVSGVVRANATVCEGGTLDVERRGHQRGAASRSSTTPVSVSGPMAPTPRAATPTSIRVQATPTAGSSETACTASTQPPVTHSRPTAT
jgi:UDP-3-O-[3-hydroxymyristoyl] glucosamine N-acyltransferase